MTHTADPANPRGRGPISLILPLFLTGMCCTSCAKKLATGEDSQVTTMGNIEVTAQLSEIRGEFPDLPRYDYAYVLKYSVQHVHRGNVEAETIYVGHYNPLKPRREVADVRVEEIGGNVERFQAGDVHRMALEVPIDDYYMGGIINKYAKENTGALYFAVWTDQVIR